MPEAQIVWTVDEELPLTTFETTPFKLARRGESLKVEVNLVAEVENNFRKRAYVKPNLPNYQTFVVRSDASHIPSKNHSQGEGSAPPPLRSEARRVGKEWVSTCRSRWEQGY